MSGRNRNLEKNLTFFPNVCILIKTNTIRGLDANAAKIAQERRCPLTFKTLSEKNRVWLSVYQGSWGFWGKFSCKKVPAQFVFGFGVFGATARLGRKWGLFPCTFPFEGN